MLNSPQPGFFFFFLSSCSNLRNSTFFFFFNTASPSGRAWPSVICSFFDWLDAAGAKLVSLHQLRTESGQEDQRRPPLRIPFWKRTTSHRFLLTIKPKCLWFFCALFCHVWHRSPYSGESSRSSLAESSSSRVTARFITSSRREARDQGQQLSCESGF